MRISDFFRFKNVRRTGGALRERGWRATFGTPVRVSDDEVQFDSLVATGLHPTKDSARDELVRVVGAMLRNHDVGAKWIGATPTLGVMIFPSGDGWAYQLVRDGKSSGVNGCSEGSRESAERMMRLHLAQIMFDRDEPDTVDTSKALIHDPSDREAHVGWCVWQQRYRAAEISGADDTECRRRADNNEDTPRPREY